MIAHAIIYALCLPLALHYHIGFTVLFIFQLGFLVYQVISWQIGKSLLTTTISKTKLVILLLGWILKFVFLGSAFYYGIVLYDYNIWIVVVQYTLALIAMIVMMKRPGHI